MDSKRGGKGGYQITTPNDRSLKAWGLEGFPHNVREKREMLQAHMNTLDLVVGNQFKLVVEAHKVDALTAYKDIINITLTEVPWPMRDLTIADIYRDFLERTLKSL